MVRIVILIFTLVPSLAFCCANMFDKYVEFHGAFIPSVPPSVTLVTDDTMHLNAIDRLALLDPQSPDKMMWDSLLKPVQESFFKPISATDNRPQRGTWASSAFGRARVRGSNGLFQETAFMSLLKSLGNNKFGIATDEEMVPKGNPQFLNMIAGVESQFFKNRSDMPNKTVFQLMVPVALRKKGETEKQPTIVFLRVGDPIPEGMFFDIKDASYDYFPHFDEAVYAELFLKGYVVISLQYKTGAVEFAFHDLFGHGLTYSSQPTFTNGIYELLAELVKSAKQDWNSIFKVTSDLRHYSVEVRLNLIMEYLSVINPTLSSDELAKYLGLPQALKVKEIITHKEIRDFTQDLNDEGLRNLVKGFLDHHDKIVLPLGGGLAEPQSKFLAIDIVRGPVWANALSSTSGGAAFVLPYSNATILYNLIRENDLSKDDREKIISLYADLVVFSWNLRNLTVHDMIAAMFGSATNTAPRFLKTLFDKWLERGLISHTPEDLRAIIVGSLQYQSTEADISSTSDTLRRFREYFQNF
jgi:hypothetical protein